MAMTHFFLKVEDCKCKGAHPHTHTHRGQHENEQNPKLAEAVSG